MKSAAFFCEKSGKTAEPWAEAGYRCVCYDTAHSIRRDRVEGNVTYRWGDVRSLDVSDLPDDLAFIFAMPPCTHLTGAGARDWRRKGIRLFIDALEIVEACLRLCRLSGVPYGMENPVGRLSQVLGDPDYTFHPWQYGDPYSKRTCLWTGGGFVMPESTVHAKPDHCDQRIHTMSPGPDRADKRSQTPAGFALAMFLANTHPTPNQENSDGS